jgi:hypothetical protein
MTNLRLFRWVFLSMGLSWGGQGWSQERPFATEFEVLSFGTLLGLPGMCYLDVNTKELIDMGGHLCPFSEQVFGVPGRYTIEADPDVQIQIRIVNLARQSNGVSYRVAGIFRVVGLPDVDIMDNSFQTIDSGNTGIITILLGGTLTTADRLSFNSTFELPIEDWINFEQIP